MAACRRTYPWPPAAVGVAPAVDVPLAVLLPPLARWMTRKTIAATPIVAAPRYRTIFNVPGRGGRLEARLAVTLLAVTLLFVTALPVGVLGVAVLGVTVLAITVLVVTGLGIAILAITVLAITV